MLKGLLNRIDYAASADIAVENKNDLNQWYTTEKVDVEFGKTTCKFIIRKSHHCQRCTNQNTTNDRKYSHGNSKFETLNQCGNDIFIL